MPTEIAVLKAGISTTVQDLGRAGYRAYGVPHSGALDPEALALANAVAGNAVQEAAFEMLYSGVVVEPRGGSMRIAIAGADAVIDNRADNTRRAVPAWQSCMLSAGERLRVGAIRESAAAYLAIEGGLDIAPLMGSVSTYARGGLGGWCGRALNAGDTLPLRQAHAQTRAERRLEIAPAWASPDVLRVLCGPHAHRFEAESREAFLGSDYTVTSASDRAGLRLSGPPLRHVGGYDLPSEGMAPGSIQVPGSGLPVILVADHPTVGGYPRIATIISADLPAAGRLRIGTRVRFAAVTAEEARHARCERERCYSALLASIVEV